VSTGDQTTDRQKQEMLAWAERAGHVVVKVHEDQSISSSLRPTLRLR
jgi:DNA invertase Pin-like site-specific DNA recombinase